MFIAAQFTIAKYWKQPKCPSANEWIKKLWYICTMKFYAAERNNQILIEVEREYEHYEKGKNNIKWLTERKMIFRG